MSQLRTAPFLLAFAGPRLSLRSRAAGDKLAPFEAPPAAFAADGAGALYVARQDGSVDQSADGGRSWRPRGRN